MEGNSDSVAEEKYSLKWNSYITHISESIEAMRYYNELVDVTIYCEGNKKIVAHQLILSVCSQYFRDVLREAQCKHPVIILKNVEYADLVAIIRFMYQGQVQVKASQLQSFLDTANLLQVRGLINDRKKKETEEQTSTTEQDSETKSSNNNSDETSNKEGSKMQPPAHASVPKLKRKRRSSTSSSNEFKQITTIKTEKLDYDDVDNDPDYSNVKMEMDSYSDGERPEFSNTDIEPDANGMYTCKICQKAFKHPMSLTLHRDTHQGKTSCVICKRKFSRAYDMRAHMVRVHQKEGISVEKFDSELM